MTYKQILKEKNINDFLYSLNVLTVEKKLMELSLDPDYDATGYKKGESKEYVFFHFLDFENTYDSVVRCIVEDYGFFSEDESIHNMFQRAGENLIKQLGEGDRESRLNKVELLGIDNIQKSINFFGSFYGDSYTMEMSTNTDFKPVASCLFLYVPKSIKTKKFYYQLLAESRLLYEEGKVNLAFFTAFTSMDLYVNYWEEYHKLEKRDNNGEIVNQRLEDRLKTVYKNALGEMNLGKNQVWTSLKGEFDTLTLLRNDISHGREITITEEQYKSLLAVISSLIISMEHQCITFDEINDY